MDVPSFVENTQEERQLQFEGVRFYPPWVLATYCILANIPLAIFLYGINIHRRGNVRFGNAIKIMAALAILAMTVGSVFSSKSPGTRFFLLGVVIGIGLFKFEKPHYEKVLAKGAIPAKWWPPLLFLAADILVMLLLILLFGPE